MSFDSLSPDAEIQVFTFAGFISSELGMKEGPVRTGLALAASHAQVIEQMEEWGFRVTAVSALNEVRTALAVLESIAAGRGDVEEGDYVNFLGSRPPYAPSQVFSLSGQHSNSPAVFAGFAVAKEPAQLTEEMARLQFNVQSSTSLAELRELVAEMESVQEGDENVIDLMGLAAAA